MKLVLIGGGHAHALAAKHLAGGNFSQITLVSAPRFTPYSGMLPGLIGGHYQFNQVHIDLQKLCDKYHIKFVEQKMQRLDCANKKVVLEDGSCIDWDLLSLDTGSTPPLPDWFSTHSKPDNLFSIKPVERFLEGWDNLLQKIEQQPDWQPRIAVIGSGAGGIEALLGMQHSLQTRWPDRDFHFSLYFRSNNILAGHCTAVQSRMAELLRQRHIHLVSGFEMKKAKDGKLTAIDGRKELVDFAVVCTGAKAPDWARESDLAVCDRGFVQVNDKLQSVSHPDVFAAGDIASMLPVAPPKAGVYAVRQAPILSRNLKRVAELASQGKDAQQVSSQLESYQAQQHFLSLLSCGDRYAIASWRRVALQGRWVWYWKDYIDQKFMKPFVSLT